MKDQKGFTLIELILVIILLGIIGAAFAAGLVPTMRASVMVDTRKEAIQSARLTMDRMVKEIRLIRSATATHIQICESNRLQFTDAYNNSIDFNRSGGSAPYTLLRNSDTLSANVQALTFIYLDKAGVTLTDAGTAGVCDTIPTTIWRIQISLQVRVGNETVDLKSEVNPGNFT